MVSEAKDLLFAAKSRSFASLRMTKIGKLSVEEEFPLSPEAVKGRK